MSDLEAGISAAKAHRYLSKDQARALVAEIEWLRAQLEDERVENSRKIGYEETRRRVWQTYITVLEERGVGWRDYPTERRLQCDLCGATSWQPIVWMASVG